MTLVWDVAPHPQVTPKERPGSFREHDVEPFPGGMRRPSGRKAAKAADGTWRSSTAWVKEYEDSRYKRA